MSILNGVIAPEIRVEFDLSSPGGPKEPTASNWTTVSNDLIRSISIRRGKTQENQVVQAGECTIVFDNRTGDFDPMNSASPYWTDLIPAFGGYSYLSTHMGVRVWARWDSTDYVLYTGYLEQLNMDYGLNPTATITFTDSIAWLAQQFPIPRTTAVGLNDTVAQRFTRVLDEVNFPTILRGIDPSVNNTMYGTKLDGDAVTLLQQAADCGPGRFFVSAAGLVRCEPITDGTDRGLVLSDSQAAGTVGYDLIEVDPGARYLVNAVGVTTVDGNGTTRGYAYATDGVSVLKYGLAQQEYTLPTNSPSPLANYLAYQYSEPIDRVRRITFSHTNLGTNFPKTLQTELADYVTVDRTTYDGRSLEFTCQVEGIEHDITAESWSMGYICSTQDVIATGEYWWGDNAAVALDPLKYGSFVDSGNNMYSFGPVNGDASSCIVSKFNALGSLLWQRQVTGVAPTLQTFALNTNGPLCASGKTVVHLNTDGSVRWQKEFTTDVVVDSVACDGAGNTIIGCHAGTVGYVVKLTSTGTISWQKQFNETVTEVYVAANETTVYVLAKIFGSWRIVKLNSIGDLQWGRAYSFGTPRLFTNADSDVFIVEKSGDKRFLNVSSSGSISWQFTCASGYEIGYATGAGEIYLSGPSVVSLIYSDGTAVWHRRVKKNGTIVDATIAPGTNDSIYLTALSAARLPDDGAKTGSYVIPGASATMVYESTTNTLTSSAISLATSTPSFLTSTLAVADSAKSVSDAESAWAITYIL